MLLSSLIISKYGDRVLFMLIHLTGVSCPPFKLFSSYQVLHLFSTGVLPKFFLSHLVLIGVVSNSILSIKLPIYVFATSKVHMVSLVSILYGSALNCVQLRCVLSFNFSTSQGS